MTQHIDIDQAAAETVIQSDVDTCIETVQALGTRCKDAFLPLLREHAISRVEIHYDGGGDEGSVGEVLAFAGSDASICRTFCATIIA